MAGRVRSGRYRGTRLEMEAMDEVDREIEMRQKSGPGVFSENLEVLRARRKLGDYKSISQLRGQELEELRRKLYDR